jgi:hypothetical protein
MITETKDLGVKINNRAKLIFRLLITLVALQGVLGYFVFLSLHKLHII